MTKNALIYAWTIIAIGLATLAGAGLRWQSDNPAAFVVCFALAAFASTRKLRLPELTGTLSPGFVFLLISVATLSWSETVVIAVVSALVQCLWRPAKPPTRVQIAFSGATLAIAGGLTHSMTWALVALRGTEGMVVLLGVAGVVLLVTNTLIVATVLVLIKEGSFETVWRSVQLRAVPYYMAGGVLANIWVRARLTSPGGVTVLAAISVYLLAICYREFISLVTA